MNYLKLVLIMAVVFFLPAISEPATVQVSCLTSTTVIDTADSERVSALVQNIDETNFVWICQAATCTATTGIKVHQATSNGTVSASFGKDEYRGPISCLADTATVIVTFTETTP